MPLTSTIRIGTPDDGPAVAELLRAAADGDAASTPPTLDTLTGHHYLLVVDAPAGGLAAAAHLTLTDDHGHLGLLAVAPPFRGTGLEHRLRGVAEALCDAFGCAVLDVPTRAA